jgi:putative ABC transport system permease protein
VADVITEDTTLSSAGLVLASRAYIFLNDLPATRLIQPGSTVQYRRLFRLPAGINADQAVEELNRRLADPGLQVRSHTQASRMTGRLQGFLNDYLGLAALVGLFLAAIGAAYVYRGFLTRRLRDLAIVMSLGMDPVRARRVYALQLALLGLAAAALACVIAALTSPVAVRGLGTFLPYPVDAHLGVAAAGRTLLLGTAGSLLIGLPLLSRLRRLTAASLFQENAAPVLEGKNELLWALPALVTFWLLAIWEANSWKNATLFVGILLASATLLGLCASALLRFLDRSVRGQNLSLRLAARHLARQRFSSVSGFLAIGLGALLLNLIPQVQKSLMTEVEAPGTGEIPSLFLFDIQPPQLEPIEAFLKAAGAHLQGLSPLVRGRLVSVNSHVFEKEAETGTFRTREEETENRFRNRGINLTWRARLSSSEKIVSGRDFSPGGIDHDQIPELSIEQRFAKRLKLKLGDLMTFDVQGVEVSGRIVNFRSVQWTSFQPNFFVQFAPGVLEGAPATFIAGVGPLEREAKRRLQNDLVRQWPNVSMIDISDVAGKMLVILGQMAWAIRAMALLALGAGFMVLFSIAQQQAQSRRAETLLLKVLGADFSFLQRTAWLEFGGLGAAAATAGALLSVLASWIFSRFMFDQVWALDGLTPFVVTLGLTVFSFIAATLATRPILNQKPWALLQTE